jgi:hypothetical protein
MLLDIAGPQVEVLRDVKATVDYQHGAVSNKGAVCWSDMQSLEERWYFGTVSVCVLALGDVGFDCRLRVGRSEHVLQWSWLVVIIRIRVQVFVRELYPPVRVVVVLEDREHGEAIRRRKAVGRSDGKRERLVVKFPRHYGDTDGGCWTSKVFRGLLEHAVSDVLRAEQRAIAARNARVVGVSWPILRASRESVWLLTLFARPVCNAEVELG